MGGLVSNNDALGETSMFPHPQLNCGSLSEQMLREQMVLPSLHFLTPAPAPAAGLARAPGLVWCPGGEYVAAIHAAPPPAHITYQHTSIPHTHQLDTPVQTRAWTQCGLLVRDSLIFARQGGYSQCPCDATDCKTWVIMIMIFSYL